ncbi:MAG: winged helix DNA-binding protein [Candidatus Binatus sp.]|uniref:winged helix DNA-binding protein n=1 Tax=Candidatus Binatus sp. TaxID=2811406 RepID=UPI00272472E1|nr:winged helix DNA-binding protein [Candidatus Binatus sp.]MDO8435019.1 winged helix DNA-binding protein [Candidatus Binatus sp.]
MDRVKTGRRRDSAAEFLEFFYPVYYQIGKAFEDALGNEQLSRKQVAILWLLRSEGGAKGRLRRKDIQRLIGTWFEISSPTITRALRSMARPPLRLVQLSEDSRSGREQMVSLTPDGKSFIAMMAKRGKLLLRPLLAQLSAEEIQNGSEFFLRAIAVLVRPAIGSTGVTSK